MASPFNGRWCLVASEGTADYFTSINCPEEYKEKLRQLGEAVKKDPNVYVEDLRVDASKLHRHAFVNGEKKKDSHDVFFGTEQDAKIGDGRPAKIRFTLESPTKMVRTEKGDGFNTTSTFEVNGNEMTVTMTSGSATAIEKYNRTG